ncbi:hypothetical protein L3X38_016763 [Prunus dulcis]|uniref:Uncharacterized protein n=1 Tax=Prunus dulcis TaxID=3755 RepID=A0AAD4Z8J1_PRUDU|nr:hypothetical protein L3X38_016763 [Prunus dulcis]
MHNPSKKHLGTAKRMLRYIQGTLDFGIEFIKGKTTTLICYCDSDWAGSEDDMRSTSGYAFTLGSEDQIADILTKALSKDRFVYLRELLGVKSAKGLEGSVDV